MMRRTDMADSPRTVIFDLDRTLIGCDSFAGFLNSLLLRDWWRVAGVVAASPLLLPLWATATTRRASLWGLLWFATVGLDSDEFASLASTHAQRLASADGIYPDGLHALAGHQQSGDRVVIVTGSGSHLVTAFCAAVGLEGVEVVGSTFRSGAGGWVVNDHCVGQRKVEMLTAAGVPPPWSAVYTDSASDLPLLQRADRRCVVNPKPRAIRALRRALGEGNFDIVRWQ